LVDDWITTTRKYGRAAMNYYTTIIRFPLKYAQYQYWYRSYRKSSACGNVGWLQAIFLLAFRTNFTTYGLLIVILNLYNCILSFGDADGRAKTLTRSHNCFGKDVSVGEFADC
jgi:hypothetical protein